MDLPSSQTGGWGTSVNHTTMSYSVVQAFAGVGSQVYVGLGGAVFIRTYSYSGRLKSWNTSPYTYTVAGMGTKLTQGQNIFIRNKGLTVSEWVGGYVGGFCTHDRLCAAGGETDCLSST